MNPRIEKLKDEIERIKVKMNRGQTRLRELEKQLIDLENADIVAAVRGVDIAPNDLAAFVQMLKEKQKGVIVPDMDISINDKPDASGAALPDYKPAVLPHNKEDDSK